jgi:hypothetical protein
MQRPYPIDPVLTAVINGYTRQDFIADLVLPRTKPLGKPIFNVNTYDENQFMWVPDTKIGRTSEVNRVMFSGTKQTFEVHDYALGHDLASKDYDGINDVAAKHAAVSTVITDIIMLDREIRVANVLSKPEIYGYSALLAVDLDDPMSNILVEFETAIEQTFPRANTMVIGRDEWNKVKRNKRLLAEITRAVGETASGRVTLEELAEILNIDKVIVGEAQHVDSQASGATKVRCWSGFISFIHQNPAALASIEAGLGNGSTFGLTGHFKKFGNTFFDGSKGTEGVTTIRSVDQCREVITAPKAGAQLLTAA